MKDFTLVAYKQYLEAIKFLYPTILRFDEYFLTDIKPSAFCLIRHDVDRKPKNALRMAKLESDMEIKATYYFRAKSHVFKSEIIKEIALLGHEVGYHYESLSDANGNMKQALHDFENNLNKLREVVSVKTISMHGSPLKPHDNRDLWRNEENHQLLITKYNLLGEVYLDIDYSDVAYITDTGRNWSSTKSNRRDKVNSAIKADFDNGLDLLAYLKNSPHPKMIFQIHPERWTDNQIAYFLQWCQDGIINLAKKFV